MKYKFEEILRKIPDKDVTFVEIPFDVEQEFGAKESR